MTGKWDKKGDKLIMQTEDKSLGLGSNIVFSRK